jgi:hypothetical protein
MHAQDRCASRAWRLCLLLYPHSLSSFPLPFISHQHLQAAVRLCDMSRDNVVHIAPVGSSTHLTLTSPIPFFPGDRFPTFNMPYNPRVVYIWPWWRQVIYGRCIVKRTFPRALIVSTRFSLRFIPHCAKLVVSFNTHPLLW